MIESTILCQKCKKELKSVGEEVIGKIGFNDHFFCEDCKVNIDIAVRFRADKND